MSIFSHKNRPKNDEVLTTIQNGQQEMLHQRQNMYVNRNQTADFLFAGDGPAAAEDMAVTKEQKSKKKRKKRISQPGQKKRGIVIFRK